MFDVDSTFFCSNKFVPFLNVFSCSLEPRAVFVQCLALHQSTTTNISISIIRVRRLRDWMGYLTLETGYLEVLRTSFCLSCNPAMQYGSLRSRKYDLQY